MSNQTQAYLSSLLQWGNDVNNKIKEAHLPEEQYDQWQKRMNDWKAQIKNLLESNQDPSQQDVYRIQEEGRQLVLDLEKYFETERNEKSAIAPGKHKLPPLPYAYDALEPYISKRIMQLHHQEHHQSYVDGLNKAEVEIYKNKNHDLLKHWMREQAFNGSGHYLHTIFWYNMSPKGGGEPKNPLLNQLKKDFGSFDNFKKLFTNAAESAEGVGWALLVWQPRAGRLGIQTAEKHQMFSLWDTIPLLVLDVWEHAYYLQYENKRSDYIKNWWNVVNWEDVQERYEKAKNVKWKPY